jgi:hypothetical protein
VVVAGFVAAIDDGLHVGHRRGEQRAHADDVGLELIRRRLKFFHALIDADVLHDETRALGHHADEVFSDVVEIAAHGAHEQTAGLRGGAAGNEQGFEHGHAGLHRAGRDEHLGDVEDVVLKILADDGHAGDEALLEHFLHGAAGGEGVLGHLFDVLGFALVEALVHVGVVDHGGWERGQTRRRTGSAPPGCVRA